MSNESSQAVVTLADFLARHKRFLESIEAMTPSVRQAAYAELKGSLAAYVGTIAGFVMADRLIEMAGELCSEMTAEELMSKVGLNRALPPRKVSLASGGPMSSTRTVPDASA